MSFKSGVKCRGSGDDSEGGDCDEVIYGGWGEPTTRRTVNRMKLTEWRRELIPQVRWCICERLDKQESPADADKPARLKRMQNCSNSTCFVSFHRIPLRRISDYQYIASSGMFKLCIMLYTDWNPVFANYKVSCLNYKYLVYRLFGQLQTE